MEILTLFLYNGSNRVCPSSSVQIFSQVCTYFDNLCITQFSNFIFLGDFNVNVKDSSHPCYQRLCDLMSLYGLSQVVSDVTHTHHNGVSSTIDLVLLSSPSQLIKCCTVSPFGNSDHNGIVTTVKWNPVTAPTHRRRTIWRYAHADWDKAREVISLWNWELMLTDDVNTSWCNWHKEFLSNKFVAQLCQAKRSYFGNLNPRDQKKFWKTIKKLSKSASSIPSLSHSGVSVSDDKDKANLLNSFFCYLF